MGYQFKWSLASTDIFTNSLYVYSLYYRVETPKGCQFDHKYSTIGGEVHLSDDAC